jgi:hypothetical protein
MNHVPTVYLASPIKRHAMWREWKRELSPSTFNIVSTWHDYENIEELELDATQCTVGWEKNRLQILEADHLLVFANDGDFLNGTLVEIGMALGDNEGTHIHLVGTYPWGSWRFFNQIRTYDTLHDALLEISGNAFHYKEHLDNDPS